MTVELNHTIVPAGDPQASAQFLADILGLSVDPPVAPNAKDSLDTATAELSAPWRSLSARATRSGSRPGAAASALRGP